MKKNVMMRVASIMLVLVLMSSSVISGTFAKYVTSDYSEDTARVAKFGVTVDGFSNMFEKTYKDTYTTDAAIITVESSNGDDLVAPGTQGTLTGFDVNGQPEVDVRVSYDVETFEMTNWTTDGTDEYCPIVFTISKDGASTDYYIGDGTASDVASLITEVTGVIEGWTVDYDANEVLDGVVDNDLVISWRWYFEDITTGNPLAAYQDDVKDTALGDRAADNTANAGKITLKVTCYVTQID